MSDVGKKVGKKIARKFGLERDPGPNREVLYLNELDSEMKCVCINSTVTSYNGMDTPVKNLKTVENFSNSHSRD